MTKKSAASEEGLEAPAVAEAQSVPVQAAPEPEPPPAAPTPAPIQAPDLSGLPSPNINHSASWAAETNINLQRFQNGKAALEAELDGIERAYEADELARREKHNEITRALLVRIKDMDDGIAMCSVALDKADELKGEADGSNSSQG